MTRVLLCKNISAFFLFVWKSLVEVPSKRERQMGNADHKASLAPEAPVESGGEGRLGSPPAPGVDLIKLAQPLVPNLVRTPTSQFEAINILHHG